MYQVNLSSVGSSNDSNYRSVFKNYFLQNAEEVCSMIQHLPSNVLVSLHEFEFDNLSDIYKDLGL